MTLLVGRSCGAFEVNLQTNVRTVLAWLGEPAICTAGFYSRLDEDTLVTVWSGVLPKVDNIFFMRGYDGGRFGKKLHSIAESSTVATRYYTIFELINGVALDKPRALEVRRFLQSLPADLFYLASNEGRPPRMEEEVFQQPNQPQMQQDLVDDQTDLHR